MEKTDQNGDAEGETFAQSLEVAEEADELTHDYNREVKQEVREVEREVTEVIEINREVREVNQEVSEVKQDRVNDSSDEDLSQQVSEEEDRVNGKVSESYLAGEQQDFEVHCGKQETGEVIEVVEEIEIIEDLKGSQKKEEEEDTDVTERGEEGEVEKKKIVYVEDDLELSDELEDREHVADPIEEQSPDVLLEDSDGLEDEKEIEEEEKEGDDENSIQERLQSQDLIDGDLKTKEPIQSVQTEEVFQTKDLLTETKEPTKENKEEEKHVGEEPPKKPFVVRPIERRRSSTENFQKLKDRFSSNVKEEEDNKNAEWERKRNKENARAQGASNMSDAKKRFGGTSEKCTQCNRTVYPMEKMEVAGRVLHKTCFKCCKCNSQLNVGRFSIGGKDMYCMTHYKQAFREKGTYDVFTPDNPIKGKWENKAHE